MVVLLAACTISLFADEPPSPRIENLTAQAAQGKVSVRFQLAHAFGAEMLEALASGLPTSLTYVVEIYRDRPNWFDDGLASSRIEIITTYNSLTREYLLNYRRDRHLVRTETFTDLSQLERAMTLVEEPALFDIGTRRPWKLKVRARADLSRGWVMYVIPWEVSTGWRETRVRTTP
jgi:hypothetical protein